MASKFRNGLEDRSLENIISETHWPRQKLDSLIGMPPLFNSPHSAITCLNWRQAPLEPHFLVQNADIDLGDDFSHFGSKGDVK